MKLSDLYRFLLLLYPASFRRQFSEEMISVLEQEQASALRTEILYPSPGWQSNF